MRNLKRALSLALAFVMVMSLMIVGTSAKSYTDADKIDNQVAVEILGEIGVMIGNDDGSFAPDRDVTRAEMAVIITRILYGNNLNVDQFKNMNTFTDVPDWAEGFVNLCASLDIIAGRGNGIFDPDATVTSAEAALMLSRALGYFKNNAEFGSDWALAAMKRATQIGIIGGDMVLQANAGLDRDDVAQMTFNTLTKAVPVQYNELLNVYYNVNQGIIYALEFNYLQTLGYTNFSLVYKSNDTVEYGRPATTWGIGSYVVGGQSTASGIEKEDLTSEGGLIASNVRMLSSDEIITVANDPTYTYTANTDEDDVYDDLGAIVCNGNTETDDDYTWNIYVNGELVFDGDANADGAEDDITYDPEDDANFIPVNGEDGDYQFTDKGAVTEIYIDDDDQTVTVVEINYYLGEISNVDEDDATVTIKSLSPEGRVLDDRTFATTDYDEDDIVVFTVDFNADHDFYICEMMAPETATGVVDRVEKEDASDDTYLKMENGDKYTYSNTVTHMAYDVSTGSNTHPELDEEYILYMTPTGYVLGFEPAEEHIAQYLYVEDSDESVRDWVARVDLPDGTNVKVDLDSDLDNDTLYGYFDEIEWLDDQENDEWATNIDYMIWDYSVSDSGVYSLSYVPYLGWHDDGTPTVDDELYQNWLPNIQINNGESYIETEDDDTDFIVDQDTIFVDTMNNVAYTGYDEVPNVENAEIAYVVEDGVASIVFILDGDIYDENSIYFMLDDTTRETFTHDGDKYWEYEDAYVGGLKDSQFVAYSAVAALARELGANAADYLERGDGQWILTDGVLYKAVKTVDDEYITELEVVDLQLNDVVAAANGSFRIKDSTSQNVEKFTCNDDTVFVMAEAVYDKNGNFDKWDISDADVDDMFVGQDDDGFVTYVTVVEQDKQYAELVYIVKDYPANFVDVNFTDNLGMNETVSVVAGQDLEFAYEIPAGYEIDNVANAEYQDGKLVLENVIANTNVVVTLEKVGYAVTLQDGCNASITDPADAVITAEDDVDVTITPDVGYSIKSVEGGYSWTNNGDGTVTVNVPAGTEDVVLNVTTEKVTYDVVKGSQKKATMTLEPSTIQIGDTLNIQATAKTAGVAGNALKVYVNDIEVGSLVNGEAAKPAVTELIQVVGSSNIFEALKNANGGHVYDVDGNEIDSYTSGQVAVYRLISAAEGATKASCNLNVKIAEAMLEGQTNVTVTIK